MPRIFLYPMPIGVAGALGRRGDDAIIESGVYDRDTPVTAFGVPIKYVNGKVQPIAEGDVVADVARGILVRPYVSRSPGNPLGAEVPDVFGQIADVMVRGYIMVRVTPFSGMFLPEKGVVVYVRKTNHGAGEYPIGGIESGADEGKCEKLPRSYFTGAMDNNGLCEIAFNL